MKYSISKFTPTKTFLSIFGIILLIIFFKFFSLMSFPDSAVVLEKGDLIPLAPKAGLTQTFVANRNNLMKIEFLVRTPGPKPGDIVSFELADETCAKTIRKGTLSPSFLSSDNLYEFSFAKIPNSAGKKYCIISTIKSKSATSKGINFFSALSNEQQLILKNSTTNETFENKTLSIRGVYVNDHWWQNFSELNQRISQYKPWFLKHFFLASIVFLFVITSIGLVAILITI